MAGDKQKRSSGSSFSLFGLFKTKNSRNRRVDYDQKDDFMKAYKVFPSDEDRGRWGVAKPGIDKDASAYITAIIEKYAKIDDVAN